MHRSLALGSLLIAACTGGDANVDLATGDAADPVTISRDCRDAPRDPLQLSTMALEGDRLRVKIEHGGGCERHTYAACWDGLVQETAPPRTSIVIHHDANGDACDALLTRDIFIDVSELAFEIGSATVADPAGRIELVGR